MSNWMTYILGLATLPALVVLFFLVNALVARSKVMEIGCAYCPWLTRPEDSRLPWWWTEKVLWWKHQCSTEHRMRYVLGMRSKDEL